MALTHFYIDPSIAAASGTGTIGDPYGDIQHALDTATAGASGNQLNIKAGTSEILAAALSWTTFGLPAAANPCIVRGYTTAADDGGIGSIDCAATYSLLAATTYNNLNFIDMELFNFGSAEPIKTGNYCALINCEIHTTSHTSYIVDLLAYSIMNNCYFHTLTGAGIICIVSTGSSVTNIFADTGSTMIGGLLMNGTGGWAHNCIIKSSNSAVQYGVRANTSGIMVSNCSVYNSTAATTTGISLIGIATKAMNNIVEGWSGVGGIGIESTAANLSTQIMGNQIYNCTTSISETNPSIFKYDNVALGASAFANPAGDDFTVGTSVKGVGYPALIGGVAASTTFIDAGACQREEAAAGGGGGIKLAGFGGGMIG